MSELLLARELHHNGGQLTVPSGDVETRNIEWQTRHLYVSGFSFDSFVS
ncbi:hypothetical protein SAMN04487948_114109 [Halogranum amylolyticum]|uniref:Uncharacterized protein n=1 Tax=Halogranum amylolyticum TaxID=660520 RepID=A0A1H8V7M3_9EURY|nr:hypothetical protein SAMN04487948_114109 [Halogranum amylolyticum]